ncbi:hypothetical protein [Citrobacter sp.]|uniref:hypothetical protein n=1 Tax=Citrobacter sp. TaxID=1896336 RepID=UPI002900F442|nr:hypothetical protein [Citrobacter sp.]MDU2844921.1 hypothetical protein [Citrobacter sp.]
MRKREREITLLYGLSLIRDDVLNHPEKKPTLTDRIITFTHHFFYIASALVIAASGFAFFIWTSTFL